jgi:hypothetical protein
MPLRTFDNGAFEVVADNGDTCLGGEAFDERVKIRPATCRPFCKEVFARDLGHIEHSAGHRPEKTTMIDCKDGPLMQRTTLVANTYNILLAAREPPSTLS